jgi:hypothetical protein
MYLKAINLEMMECMRTYDAVGRIELPCSGPQACVGGQQSVFGKPGADGTLRDLSVKPPAENGLRFRERVAEVECG